MVADFQEILEDPCGYGGDSGQDLGSGVEDRPGLRCCGQHAIATVATPGDPVVEAAGGAAEPGGEDPGAKQLICQQSSADFLGRLGEVGSLLTDHSDGAEYARGDIAA